MKEYIEIEKDAIPYTFEILLLDNTYEMEINYNENADLFTITLSKDGVVLVYNEPLIYGVTLFTDIYMPPDFPAVDLVPLDLAGVAERITWTNLGETVFLYLNN